MAKGKVLNTVISLGGSINGSLLKALNTTTTKTAKAAKAMNKSMSSETMSASKAMSSSFKSVAGSALKIFGVVKAAGMLKDFAGESIAAAKEQIEVQTKLQTVLKNVKSIQIRGPNAAAEAASKLKDLANNLEGVGVVGDEVTMAGMQQLATFQLSDKEISKLSVGMTDLLAQQKGLNASQGDAVSIGNMIGKAMNGSASALSKVGISFSKAQEKAIKTGDATQRAATISEVLKENVGGVNKALGKTDQGQMLQLKNTMDEMKENIGYFLLPMLAQLAKGALPYVQSALTGLKTVLKILSPLVSGLFSAIFNLISDMKPLFEKSIGKMAPIMSEMLQPFENMSQSIIPVLMGEIKNLLPKILKIGEDFQPIFSQLFNFIATLLPAIGDSVKAIIPLKDTFEKLMTPLLSLITQLLPKVIGFATQLIPIFLGLAQSIAPFVTIIVNAVLPAINSLIPPIMNAVDTILPVLLQFINLIKTVIVQLFSDLSKLAPVIAIVAQGFSVVLTNSINFIIAIIKNLIAVISNILTILSNLISFIVNIFTGNWQAAWLNVQNIFKGIFNGFGNIAKIPLNAVISLVNSAIGGINGLTGVINKIPGVEIGKIPQIPYLAKGATITSPTLAMIGEGKVPETVVPHNNTLRSRNLLAEAARGVGVNIGNNNSELLPAVDRIMSSLSYFGDKFAAKKGSSDRTGTSETVNNTNNSKGSPIIYSPQIYAQDVKGVKEALKDDFEQFKAWYKQMKEEEEREVYA